MVSMEISSFFPQSIARQGSVQCCGYHPHPHSDNVGCNCREHFISRLTFYYCLCNHRFESNPSSSESESGSDEEGKSKQKEKEKKTKAPEKKRKSSEPSASKPPKKKAKVAVSSFVPIVARSDNVD